ncbi:MAG: AlpA family transcriptional regulator [Pseudomonadales bacterium]|nr:AlpA family transcriptional regulator [Pseudomonadales bacterium]
MDQINTPRLLRRPEVLARIGVKTSALYEMVAKGAFPQPVPIGARSVAWVESEVNSWVQARIAARDTRKAA